MMTRNISFIFLGLMVIMAFPLSAQDDVELGPRIKAIRAQHYTQKMDLSPEEAETFWPVFNEREKELLNVARKKKAKKQQIKNNMKVNTPKFMEKLLDEYADLERQEAEIRRRYHDRFKEVLPIKKLAMFYQAEESWRERLIMQIMKRRQRAAQQGGG